MPDQGRQVVTVRLEGNGLLVDIEIDIVKRPASQLALAKGGLQPAVFVSGRKQPRRRLVNRLEYPKLKFELLDDDDRSALELQLRDPAAQIVDLEHVFVHGSSVFKNRRVGQLVNQRVSGDHGSDQD